MAATETASEQDDAFPETTEADVVVVGLGPGGEHVVGRLAGAGVDVVGVEAELVGGECPYWACVPSKMMLRGAGLLAEARRVPGMAGQASVTPDFSPVAARIHGEATDEWNDQAAADRLTDAGARLVRGRGALAGPGTVEVHGGDGRPVARVHARRGVVLATGSRPHPPPLKGLTEVPYWTNRQAVAATEAPESLLVLGAGAVGVELAQAFARFGTRVTVVEAGERILSAEEPEASAVLAEALSADGVTLRVGARAERVSANVDGSVTLTLAGDEELTARHLLVATGRRPDLASLGLDTVPGLDPGPDARALPVDGRMRAAAEGVWAVGDLVGRGAFTHVAMYQAEIAIRDILGLPGPEADYRALSRVTFTDPEIGAVGLTEAQAREMGLTVRTGVAPLEKSSRGWIHKAGNAGFVKLVELLPDPGAGPEGGGGGILVGATSAGPCGGEVVYGLAVAVQARVSTERMRHMIHAFPTFHRAVEDALRALERGDGA
ncbi:dihydrolipoyl dehydrogenase family protein [Streptomyces sp. 4N509B]|uniref:dihydrolipoyl dehydrogenase family protein n=1 Tax=Streptomyces sp. 4N509B TaxID=3457413 RepID=UPI003FD15A99